MVSRAKFQAPETNNYLLVYVVKPFNFSAQEMILIGGFDRYKKMSSQLALFHGAPIKIQNETLDSVMKSAF